MGTGSENKIDSWLVHGGLVLTASERTARAVQRAYHHRRRTEGLPAWPAPGIHSWKTFTSSDWQERVADGRMLLTPIQERSLWAGIIGREPHLATVLEGPRDRLAALAMEAHELLASYAPRYLQPHARSGWDRDPGAFSAWLTSFDRLCREQKLLSLSITPLSLIDFLKDDLSERPPILVTGFDRLLPAQREVLDAWGQWQQLAASPATQQLHYFSTESDSAELAACAAWCKRHLAANPQSRLLVIARQVAAQRGEMERAFLQLSATGDAPLFEFSLGVPLGSVPLIHAAYLVLRWLDGTLLEHELDWLLSTGFTTVDSKESLALQSYMRSLRRRGLARTDWSLEAFAAQSAIFEGTLGSWYRRMTYGRRKLVSLSRRKLSPFEWAREVPSLLESLGIPVARRLASAEFQAWHRWEQTMDSCGSLGFDGRRISWKEFLGTLARTLDETLFTPESSDAPIQIAGPAESAGLTADAIWFLGADEESWPGTAPAHPLLPIYLQREANMPHATMRGDWELAQAVTARLAASAPEVCFSYARQSAEADARPSRLVMQIAGPPQPLPANLAPPQLPPCAAVSFNDASRVSLPINTQQSVVVHGGSTVLTAQSQCPFKAFATARLGAQGWEAAEYGLSASQRGQLLHAVLHSIWGGPPDGLRSLSDLNEITDRTAFVARHVEKVLREEMPSTARDRLPRRYLDLEAMRLTRVVRNWLDYEAQRLPFLVAETEVDRAIQFAGLTLTLRLDRVDRLSDNSVVVIDYKTGNVARKAWDLPRPDDVQLPLYTCFALEGERSGGLLFAKLRAGEAKFVGYARSASTTLFSTLGATDPLLRQPLTDDQMQAWKETIEQLAHDFIAGRAVVDPREFPGTCDRCDLHAVCRIHENRSEPSFEEDTEDVPDE
jgi:ATP-dependent helicase/nuclease subunit B